MSNTSDDAIQRVTYDPVRPLPEPDADPDVPDLDLSGLPFFVGIETLAEVLGFEVHATKVLVANGDIPSVRVGRRRLVPRASIPAIAGHLAKGTKHG